MIDKLLREALDTRIVNRFLGYQGGAEVVDRQVYALWNVLQKRKFRYSSVSNTSLSSNVVFSQRVRTFDDALESSQINCVDGSVLFASLLRAINIEPILVRTPGHMFVGYYTDSSHKDMNFLETTMIGMWIWMISFRTNSWIRRWWESRRTRCRALPLTSPRSMPIRSMPRIRKVFIPAN